MLFSRVPDNISSEKRKGLKKNIAYEWALAVWGFAWQNCINDSVRNNLRYTSMFWEHKKILFILCIGLHFSLLLLSYQYHVMQHIGIIFCLPLYFPFPYNCIIHTQTRSCRYKSSHNSLSRAIRLPSLHHLGEVGIRCRHTRS